MSNTPMSSSQASSPAFTPKIQTVSEKVLETGFSQSIALDPQNPILLEHQSKYQSIRILKSISDYYGKILVLDNVVQLTEGDVFSYSEMMTHVPMMEHPNPKRVLVVGGGDGYVLSEVLKHPSVEHVDHVDLDQDVISICTEHFSWGSAWKDPRVNLHIADGHAFVKNAPDNYYDVIIQDSSDPTFDDENGNVVELPSAVLYSEDHFRGVHRVLRPGGLFNFQAECMNIPSDVEGMISWRKQALGVGFATSRYGSLVISSYPTGQIGFLMCQKENTAGDVGLDMDNVRRRFDYLVKNDMETKYYQPKLQRSCFDLPRWIDKLFHEEDGDDHEVSVDQDKEL